MADVGLAEKSGAGDVGRSGPDLLRFPPSKLDDELVVRDGWSRPLEEDLLARELFRQTDRVDRLFIVDSRVVHDADVDAAMEGGGQRLDEGLPGEFIDARAQGLAAFRRVDVRQAGFRQAAREPRRFLVLQAAVAHVIGNRIGQRSVLELGCEAVARHDAAVEPHAVASVVFALSFDLDVDGVSVAQASGRTELRNDRELILDAGRCGVVGPEEALDRLVVRREHVALFPIGRRAVEELDAREEVRRRSGGGAPDSEAAKIVGRLRLGIDSEQHDVRARDGLDMKLTVARGPSHAVHRCVIRRQRDCSRRARSVSLSFSVRQVPSVVDVSFGDCGQRTRLIKS